MTGRPRTRLVVAAALVLATLAAILATVLGLRLDPNVASLLPERGEAASLRRYLGAFGGSDLALVLIEGDDTDECAAVADEVAQALAARPSVARASARIEATGSLDPMLAWRYADPAARAELARALTPEGMRARLAETRALLLAPGSAAIAETIAANPLRLTQLALGRAGLGGGLRAQANGAFASDDGKARLVLVKPRGESLRGADAKAFTADAEAVLDDARRAHPRVTLGLTGGHAIAAATEAMLRSDIKRSSVLSTFLAAITFALVFRRVRALVAVLPPLALGTAWTAGLAAALPGGLSAIAVAFMAVVVGVGVDTGVHVYAALLDARRDGFGPAEAAIEARRRTWRPVMTAAITAAAAFGALGLSEISALRQLGMLSAAGEVLTAIAIVLVTPEIGAWLERKPPPREAPSRWTEVIAWLTASRGRAAIVACAALTPIVALAVLGPPPIADAIVAVRPAALAPLAVERRIFAAFGGQSGQWVVLVADPDRERARERADRVAERLAASPADIESVDALGAIAPAAATQARRFDARDALDLPAKAEDLARALREEGFSPERFEGALASMRRAPRDEARLDDLARGPGAIVLARYLGEEGGDHLVALYVRPSAAPGAADRVEAAIREVDPRAAITGYRRLEVSLRAALAHDLPRIGLVAGVLVALALAALLRRPRDVVIAALVLCAEIAAVLLLIRAVGIPLHAYDALVLPVLLGITVDEAMFLLRGARRDDSADVIRETLHREGPSIAATALTTAAGFAALGLCEFDGLRHLGQVGALGSVAGLVIALLVVPASLRLWGSNGASPRP